MSSSDSTLPLKVNKWDGQTVKNTLDDAVKKVLNEHYQWTEKHTLADGRLLISFIAVAFAGFALIWDLLSYFVLMGLLQLYQWYIEKSVFYQSLDEDPTGKTPHRYWKWSSNMKRYDDKYTLEAEYVQGTRKGHMKVTKSITAFIDDDGEVLAHLLKKEVQHLHDALLPPGKSN